MKKRMASEFGTLLGMPPMPVFPRRAERAGRPAPPETETVAEEAAATARAPAADENEAPPEPRGAPAATRGSVRPPARNRLGMDTLKALGPAYVKPLARSLPPPSRSLPTTELILALLVVISALTSASVALAR